MPTMEDVMRGDSRPRYKLDLNAIEQRFGAPLGPVLLAFTKLALLESPFNPSAAFEDLSFVPVYLHEQQPKLTPAPRANLLPLFESTSGRFWVGVERSAPGPIDQRPVLLVARAERVLAPTLAPFLGLVAYAGADAIADDESAEDLREIRKERLAHRGFGRLSRALCKLPLVELPKLARVKPAKLQAVTTLPRGGGLMRIEQLVREGQDAAARRELLKQITLCLELGDLTAPDKWPDIEGFVQVLRPRLTDEQREGLEARGVRLA